MKINKLNIGTMKINSRARLLLAGLILAFAAVFFAACADMIGIQGRFLYRDRHPEQEDSAPGTFTVHFRANDVYDTLIETRPARENESIILPGTGLFSKDGYAFTGWNTEADGSGEMWLTGQSFTVVYHTTFYAIWMPEAYGIALEINGQIVNTHSFHPAAFGYSQQELQLVTIRNTGDQPTGIMSVNFYSGGDYFWLQTTSLGSITQGSSTVFPVRPANNLNAGNHNAIIRITGENNVFASLVVNFTVNPAIIQIAEITVTAPEINAVPNLHATTGSAQFTAGTVSWNPDHNLFGRGIEYTATVTLTAYSHNFVFAGYYTEATVNGNPATPPSILNDGRNALVSFTFEATPRSISVSAGGNHTVAIVKVHFLYLS